MPTKQGQEQVKIRWAATAGILVLLIFLYVVPYLKATKPPDDTHSLSNNNVSTTNKTQSTQARTAKNNAAQHSPQANTQSTQATASEPHDGVVFPSDFVQSVHQPGVVTYVNFWAEWCLPCKEELPLFEKWAQQLRAQQLRAQQTKAQHPQPPKTQQTKAQHPRPPKAQQLKGVKRRIVLLHLDNTEFGHDAKKQQRARRMQKQLAPTPIALWAPLFATDRQGLSKTASRPSMKAQNANSIPHTTGRIGSTKSSMKAQNVSSIPLNQLPYHLIINSRGQVAHQWGGAIIDTADIQAAHTKFWGTH